MRRSISSDTGSPSVPVLALVLAGIVLGSASLPAGEYLDDVAIKAGFEQDLSRRFSEGGLVSGAAIVAQLSEAPAVLPGPFAPPPPSEPGNPYSRARAATLVFGHLYLCGKCDRHHASFAGAVLLSADGLALTNYHVLDNRQALVFGARTHEGRLLTVGKVLAASQDDDLALVRLEGAEGLPFVSLGRELDDGAELFVLSHPDGHFYSLSRGYLSRKYLAAKTRAPRLQITADFAKGSSGCGIFDPSGNLVGLASSTNSIYYTEIEGKKDNLQMVVKSGVPVESIRKLLGLEP